MKITHSKAGNQHKHKWVSKSGFYVRMCVSYEEPTYYPPEGLVQLEVCPLCGSIRLPKGVESWRGYPITVSGEVEGDIEL